MEAQGSEHVLRPVDQAATKLKDAVGSFTQQDTTPYRQKGSVRLNKEGRKAVKTVFQQFVEGNDGVSVTDAAHVVRSQLQQEMKQVRKDTVASVVAELKAEGLTRRRIGKEAFQQRVKEKIAASIHMQDIQFQRNFLNGITQQERREQQKVLREQAKLQLHAGNDALYQSMRQNLIDQLTAGGKKIPKNEALIENMLIQRFLKEQQNNEPIPTNAEPKERPRPVYLHERSEVTAESEDEHSADAVLLRLKGRQDEVQKGIIGRLEGLGVSGASLLSSVDRLVTSARRHPSVVAMTGAAVAMAIGIGVGMHSGGKDIPTAAAATLSPVNTEQVVNYVPPSLPMQEAVLAVQAPSEHVASVPSVAVEPAHVIQAKPESHSTEQKKVRSESFSQTTEYPGMPGVKKLKIPTFAQIQQEAEQGHLFFENNHPVVIVESEFLWYYASQPEQQRAKLLNAYADGIISGLRDTYGDDKQLLVALEAGHWSDPPAGRGTLDSGASAKLAEGGTLTEKQMNLQLSRLIAQKIRDSDPNWQPVINVDEHGYAVGEFPNLPRAGAINNTMTMMPMRRGWEQLASQAAADGIPMVRLAIHFNGSDGNPKGGMVISQADGRYEQESGKLAKAIADAEKAAVTKVDGGYTQVVQKDDPNDPYTITDTATDNPADVRAGNVGKVKEKANKIVAAYFAQSPLASAKH